MPSSKRKPLRYLVLLAALAAVAVLFDWQRLAPVAQDLIARVMPKAQPAHQPIKVSEVPVSAAKAAKGDFPVVLTGLGNVQAYNSVLVRTRVDGEVVKINFVEGQTVHAGDLLAQIDPRPFQATLDQALAKKQQDAANLENAKRDLNRYQSLARSDFATRQQLDTQTSMVAQLTAQIAADDAQIENARTQLDYTNVRAPITGRTGLRMVDQGNIVNASSQTGIVSIAQIEPIAVVFTAPENQLPEITAGLKAGPLSVAALSSDGSRELDQGRLELFNNEIDTASGTIRLKAAFDNKAHNLWPGLSVQTKLTVSVRKGVVLVPAPAVQRGPNGLYVFVVGPDDKVEQRPIKVTLTNDQVAMVDTGLQAGETVVTAGQYRVEGGTLVKIVPDAPRQQTSEREPS